MNGIQEAPMSEDVPNVSPIIGTKKRGLNVRAK
jgi:hypothetical protein